MQANDALKQVLKSLRKKNNEYMLDMAENINVTAAFLSALENNKKKVPSSFHKKIIAHYNITNIEIKELKNAIKLANTTYKHRKIIENLQESGELLIFASTLKEYANVEHKKTCEELEYDQQSIDTIT